MKMEAELLYLSLMQPEVAMSPDDLEFDLLPEDLLEETELATVVLLGRFLIINAVFSLGSDMVAQTVIEEKPSSQYNWERTGYYIATGTVFVGMSQFFRLYLIRSIFADDTTLKTALEKTCFNQLLLSPIVNAGAMAAVQFTRTWSWLDVKQKLYQDYWEAQLVGYAVKPVGNLAAFVLFPTNIVGQLVITRVVAFGYNTYFSVVSHKDIRKTVSENEEEDDGDGEEEQSIPNIEKQKPSRNDVLCCSVM